MGKEKRNREYAKSIKQALPQWVEDGFPARKPILTLSAMQEVDGTWVAYVTDDEDTHYVTPVEAYDARNSNELDWQFTKLINRPGWGRVRGGLFFEKGAGHRLLIAHTSEDTENIIRSDYYYFLKLTKKYRKNPKNWALAYEWLRCHPLFWYRQYDTVKKEHVGHWETDNGLDKTWVSVREGRAKGGKVLIEHGPWHELSAPSLDHRLNAWAPTFEKAYVKLAKNVDKYYAEDGTDRNTSE